MDTSREILNKLKSTPTSNIHGISLNKVEELTLDEMAVEALPDLPAYIAQKSIYEMLVYQSILTYSKIEDPNHSKPIEFMMNNERDPQKATALAVLYKTSLSVVRLLSAIDLPSFRRNELSDIAANLTDDEPKIDASLKNNPHIIDFDSIHKKISTGIEGIQDASSNDSIPIEKLIEQVKEDGSSLQQHLEDLIDHIRNS